MCNQQVSFSLSDEVNSEQIINTDIDDLYEEKTDTQKI